MNRTYRHPCANWFFYLWVHRTYVSMSLNVTTDTWKIDLKLINTDSRRQIFSVHLLLITTADVLYPELMCQCKPLFLHISESTILVKCIWKSHSYTSEPDLPSIKVTWACQSFQNLENFDYAIIRFNPQINRRWNKKWWILNKVFNVFAYKIKYSCDVCSSMKLASEKTLILCHWHPQRFTLYTFNYEKALSFHKRMRYRNYKDIPYF